MKKMLLVSSLSLFVWLSGFHSSAYAQYDRLEDSIIAFYSVAFTVPSVVGLIGGTVRLVQQKHAPAWGTFGLVSGIISSAFSGALLGIYATSSSSSKRARWSAVLGPQLAIGLVTMGVSIANLATLSRYHGRLKVRKRMRMRRKFEEMKREYRQYRSQATTVGTFQ